MKEAIRDIKILFPEGDCVEIALNKLKTRQHAVLQVKMIILSSGFPIWVAIVLPPKINKNENTNT